ncbi:MAG TPA: proteasome-type protease [Nitrospiria bacterium]|nr:proteasome-type protease [Nitrospiria bacterium]HUK55640.1 proteasome-type protease [Nitrospiria bacterium]
MTYCIGMWLESGLVFASDSRTNGGVDHVATFRKMTVYEKPGDRVLVMLTAGNLSVTQGVINILSEDAHVSNGQETIWTATSLFHVARIIGGALRKVYDVDGSHLKQHGEDFNAAIILGGQIRAEAPRLFHIYSAGNFIESTPETCYFQIGEIKYGKPIIDRLITRQSTLTEGAKCALLSFDSTIRSNISVGLPIDLLCYERDRLRVDFRRCIDQQDPYFNEIKRLWGEGLREAFATMPDPSWQERLDPV